MATARKTSTDKQASAPRRSAKAAAPPATAAPARKAPRKKPVPAPTPDAAPATDEATGSSGLWRAGLKALDTVRQDVTRRHTNVIESLLGIAPARSEGDAKAAPRAFPNPLEGLGLRKFEDVFDQRVASALERLGMPTREEVQALRTQLEEISARLDRLDPPPAKASARRKR